MSCQGYDLIGDIHGCALSLRMLLARLGYRQVNGVYRHPQRKVIFLGDIIDRGPHIREALQLVRSMVDAGEAHIVMGNHEYNFLSYMTPHPDRPGAYLREHTPRHERILQQTLKQLAPYGSEQQDYMNWFLELPLFLEFEHFRVVHACWHQGLIDRFRDQYGGPCIDHDFLCHSAIEDSFEWEVMDRLLRGTHLRLPNNEMMVSKDGFRRHFFRTKFWMPDPQYLVDVVFQPDPLPAHLARLPITPEQREDLICYGPDEKLLFIGHYWRQGTPEPVTNNIACLDYSAVKFGKMVAYRLDDEPCIRPDKFVWVDVAREVHLSNVEVGAS
ncbi:metallophosphoesterase [Marinobacterium weihaiense]|uniref:Metallophosphoesterase n=1 Tax=Marinobacterium weihaiense TaxID=2851016 RepID=A0ABS6M7K7_9GAMM|nr:metallophosphoesterase [Marinobacterium weihaiense]MBV0932274.1 metallophosphoesterase [Marinobacterium weihaiense]